MSAILIDGRMVAKKWKDYAAQRTQRLIEKGVTPHLAVILVGENAASQVYVRNKEMRAFTQVFVRQLSAFPKYARKKNLKMRCFL